MQPKDDSLDTPTLDGASSPSVTPTVITPTVISPSEPAPSAPELPTNNAETVATPSPEPVAASPMAISGGQIPPNSSFPPAKPSPKKMFLIVAAAVALFGGVGGYIFGFYLPNQPENVWQSGLNNSGKAITKIVNDLTTKDRIELLKKTEIAVTAEVNGAGYDFSGSVNSKLDGDKSVTGAKLSSSDKSTQKMNLQLDILADVAEGKIYPDIYFKLAGLKSFGEDSLFFGFNKYDDKWVNVSSEYLESFYADLEDKPTEKQEPINSGDVAELVKTVSDTTNEYLFTSNKDKAVLVNKSFKGKEIVDGIETFRYEVGIDKNHAKDYCKALSRRVLDLALSKKLSGSDKEELKSSKENVDKDCIESVDRDIKDDETLEAWVNTKYKIIHKIRQYEGDDKTIYTEVGQIYKGGNNLSLFYSYHEEAEKLDVKLVMDLDTKKLFSKGTFTATKKTDESYDVKATLEVKPYNGEVKVDKPNGAIDIKTILQELGLDFSSNESGGAGSTRDIERQTDIKALQGQLEAQYALYGTYPSLADLNNPAWRKTNTKGLDDEALKDPDGTSNILATTANESQYGYQPEGCDASGKECQSYTLEALLSNGDYFTKRSLN